MTDTYNVAKTKICYWDIINRTQILLNLFVQICFMKLSVLYSLYFYNLTAKTSFMTYLWKLSKNTTKGCDATVFQRTRCLVLDLFTIDLYAFSFDCTMTRFNFNYFTNIKELLQLYSPWCRFLRLCALFLQRK